MAIHILNGDALKDQFPAIIEGEIIIMREALVEGPLYGNSPEEFYDLRASYLEQTYGPEEATYHQRILPEFEKIANLPEDESIYIWFEDDLFCQVNMWFVAHLIYTQSKNHNVHWVRPTKLSMYGFGAYKPEELPQLMESAIKLVETDLQLMNHLWASLQTEDLDELNRIAAEIPEVLSPVKEAVQTRIDQQNGKPEAILREILDETKAGTFGPVFQEFCKRAPQFGFGDLQVKHLYDKLLDK